MSEEPKKEEVQPKKECLFHRLKEPGNSYLKFYLSKIISYNTQN